MDSSKKEDQGESIPEIKPSDLDTSKVIDVTAVEPKGFGETSLGPVKIDPKTGFPAAPKSLSEMQTELSSQPPKPTDDLTRQTREIAGSPQHTQNTETTPAFENSKRTPDRVIPTTQSRGPKLGKLIKNQRGTDAYANSEREGKLGTPLTDKQLEDFQKVGIGGKSDKMERTGIRIIEKKDVELKPQAHTNLPTQGNSDIEPIPQKRREKDDLTKSEGYTRKDKLKEENIQISEVKELGSQAIPEVPSTQDTSKGAQIETFPKDNEIEELGKQLGNFRTEVREIQRSMYFMEKKEKAINETLNNILKDLNSVKNQLQNLEEVSTKKEKVTSPQSQSPAAPTTPPPPASRIQPSQQSNPDIARLEAKIAALEKINEEREKREEQSRKDRNRRIAAIVTGVALGTLVVATAPASTVAAVCVGSMGTTIGSIFGGKIVRKMRENATTELNSFKRALSLAQTDADRNMFQERINQWESKQKKYQTWRDIFYTAGWFSGSLAVTTLTLGALRDAGMISTPQSQAPLNATGSANIGAPAENATAGISNIESVASTSNIPDITNLNTINMNQFGWNLPENANDFILTNDVNYGPIHRNLLNYLRSINKSLGPTDKEGFFRAIKSMYENGLTAAEASAQFLR